MKNLLIYIPTYNRFDLLTVQLNSIVSAINNIDLKCSIEIIVSDNASADERYFSLPEKYPHSFISFRRHAINIGAVGNVIRVFELDGWDYIWVLSDDDSISPDALSIISDEIDKNDYDLYYLKNDIKGDNQVNAGEEIVGIESYIRNFSSLSMMGLISANIYSHRIKQYVEYMYLYGYTLFPHVAAVLKLLQSNNGKVKCLGGKLVEYRKGCNSYSHIYEMALTNVLFLTEVIEDKKNKKLFIRKYIKDFGASHFFSKVIKNRYNFMKVLSQIGLWSLLICSLRYLNLQFLIMLKSAFPKLYDRYRKMKDSC